MNQDRGHRRRPGLGIAAALVTALAAVPATALAAGPALAAAATPVNATQLAAAAYPGVQLIEVDFDAVLTVPAAKLNASAMKRLQQRLARGLITGAVDATEQGVVDALVEAIAADPLTYFVPDKAGAHHEGGTQRLRHRLGGHPRRLHGDRRARG